MAGLLPTAKKSTSITTLCIPFSERPISVTGVPLSMWEGGRVVTRCRANNRFLFRS